MGGRVDRHGLRSKATRFGEALELLMVKLGWGQGGYNGGTGKGCPETSAPHLLPPLLQPPDMLGTLAASRPLLLEGRRS